MSNNFLNPVTTQTWANGRHIVRCVKVIQETWDVRTFCFMADQPIMFFFKPGQFVTLELEIEGQPIMRSYTISSSPSVPYSYSLVSNSHSGADMVRAGYPVRDPSGGIAGVVGLVDPVAVDVGEYRATQGIEEDRDVLCARAELVEGHDGDASAGAARTDGRAGGVYDGGGE